MKNVSGNGGFLNKVRGPFLSTAMALNALALGSSGCSPSQDAIRASHAPVDKFDLHPALTNYIRDLDKLDIEARDKILDELFTGRSKVPAFQTIANRGFPELFSLKKPKPNDDEFVFSIDDHVRVSLAAAFIQNELEQIEGRRDPGDWQFYNLVHSSAMEYFCNAWDELKRNPRNLLLERVIDYYETNFKNFIPSAKLDKNLIMEKLNEAPNSRMRLEVFKYYAKKALGVDKPLPGQEHISIKPNRHSSPLPLVVPEEPVAA